MSLPKYEDFGKETKDFLSKEFPTKNSKVEFKGKYYTGNLVQDEAKKTTTLDFEHKVNYCPGHLPSFLKSATYSSKFAATGIKATTEVVIADCGATVKDELEWTTSSNKITGNLDTRWSNSQFGGGLKLTLPLGGEQLGVEPTFALGFGPKLALGFKAELPKLEFSGAGVRFHVKEDFWSAMLSGDLVGQKQILNFVSMFKTSMFYDKATAFGVDATYNVKKDEKDAKATADSIAVVASVEISADSKLKAKVDNNGVVSLGLVQNLGGGAKINIGTQYNAQTQAAPTWGVIFTFSS
jgi:hypothetical protein